MPWLDVILRVVMSVELMMSRWRIWYGGYLLENGKKISDILEILLSESSTSKYPFRENRIIVTSSGE